MDNPTDSLVEFTEEIMNAHYYIYRRALRNILSEAHSKEETWRETRHATTVQYDFSFLPGCENLEKPNPKPRPDRNNVP